MRVKSPEIIRKKADFTEYRMAKMLGISQTNYSQIISGKIKTPSSKVSTKLVIIAVNFAGYTYESATALVAKDLGISEDDIKVSFLQQRKRKKL